VNIVGAGAGPAVVGFLNDLYAASYGDLAIRYSLATVATTGFLGALCFYASSRSLVEDLRRARE
jgi:hypothetical protein